MLLFVSLSFYGSFNWSFLVLLLGMILATYCAGLCLHRFPGLRWQLVPWAALILFPLAFYKYLLIWFSQSLQRVVPVSDLDFGAYGDVLVPLGLSFFTFQCLGYVFDVRRGYYEPERDLVGFALFVAFFPQLLAGPIERWPGLSEQLVAAHRPTPDMVLEGLQLLAYGLFLKLVLGDWFGVYVDNAYTDPSANSSPAALLGLYGFTIQLYGDFCGYSLIALGSARLFGIRLTVNFRQPLLSRTIAEFWQRWHISLTRWIGDYLYRPLGLVMVRTERFSRTAQEAVVLLVTWVILGLWHGANWTFLVFGLCQAAMLLIHGLWRRSHRGKGSAMVAVGSWFLTFHLVVVTFGLIRAPTLTSYGDLILAAAALSPGRIPVTGILVNVVVAFVLIASVELTQRFRPEMRLKGLVSRTASVGILAVLVLVMGFDEGRTFIYFRF